MLALSSLDATSTKLLEQRLAIGVLHERFVMNKRSVCHTTKACASIIRKVSAFEYEVDLIAKFPMSHFHSNL